MNANRLFFIWCLLLCFVGGGSQSLAAERWDFPVSKPDGSFGGGMGTKSNPFLINHAQQLADLASLVTEYGNEYSGKYFVLTRDITLNDIVLDESGNVIAGASKSWTPIGNGKYMFRGVFDGKGHTINGLYLNSTETKTDVQGLFGCIKDCTISNLNLKNCHIYVPEKSVGYYLGVLSGWAEGYTKCKNVHVENSSILAEKVTMVAGLIGMGGLNFSDRIDLDNCSFDGNIYTLPYSDAAGLVARCKGILSNCKTKGNIYITDTANGGYYGYKSYDWYIAGLSCLVQAPNGVDVNVQNCVNYIDIHLLCDGIIGGYQTDYNTSYYYIEVNGLCYSSNTIKSCANFGNLYVGPKYDSQTCSVCALWYSGIEGKNVIDCANYGNVITKGNVNLNAGETDSSDDYNIIDFGIYADNSATRCVSIQKDNHFPTTDDKHRIAIAGIYCHNNKLEDCHYYFLYNDDVKVTHRPDAEKHSSLSDFTDPNFFTNKEWGVVSVDEASPYYAYNGMPLLVRCGGKVKSIEGNGTADKPYIIDNLELLKNMVSILDLEHHNNADVHYRLDADINMSGTMESIGTAEYPFKGHFDGNGHAITGLRNTLFGYMHGTVKNLSLLDCYIEISGGATTLATYVGDADNKAEVSNCYASGVVQANNSMSDNTALIGGLCYSLAEGSSVHDCYFKGHLVANNSNLLGSGGTAYISGIAASNKNTTDDAACGISNCYASFKAYTVGSFLNNEVYGISMGGVRNSYAVAPVTADVSGCTVKDAEAELSAGELGGQWIQGLYRPVLKGTKYYEVTTPEGDITYLDGIPAEAAEEGTGNVAAYAKTRAKGQNTDIGPDALKSNYITCYVPESNEELYDQTLMSLPNVAIYSDEYKTDVIPNFYLDNREDLKYTPTPGATGAMGAMYYPLKQNDTGWHMLCLPGYVTKSLFPNDSRLFVVDGVDSKALTVTVSEVDTVSSATPFIAYVPVEAGDVNLVSFGNLVFTPRTPTATSPLEGTFANVSATDCCSELSADGATMIHNLVADITPFHAWLPGLTADASVVTTPTGIKLVGKDENGSDRIYDLRGVEMQTEKGIYIKGGKVRIK